MSPRWRPVAFHVKVLPPGRPVPQGLSSDTIPHCPPFHNPKTPAAERQRGFSAQIAAPSLPRRMALHSCPVRDRAADEVRGKGKIAVVRPIARDDIRVAGIQVEVLHQIGFCLRCQGRRRVKHPILQQNSQPVEHGVPQAVQFQNTQPVAGDAISVGIARSGPAPPPTPLPCRGPRSVKADAIVVIGLSHAETRLGMIWSEPWLNDLFHDDPPSLFIILPGSICASPVSLWQTARPL